MLAPDGYCRQDDARRSLHLDHEAHHRTAPHPAQSPSLRGRSGAAACELKFVLDEPVAAVVERRLRDVLTLDPHCDPAAGGYRLTSLYCDTPQWDVYHRHGRHGLCKFRLRRYGDAPQVFLERKSKQGGHVRKRRTTIALDHLPALTNEVADRDWSGAWYQGQLRRNQLRPVCQISYQRQAYFGFDSEGPLRLTFDRQIVGGLTSDWSFAAPLARRTLLEQGVVCEFKFQGVLPSLFKSVIHDLQLVPRGLSKYRTCIAACEAATGGTAHA